VSGRPTTDRATPVVPPPAGPSSDVAPDTAESDGRGVESAERSFIREQAVTAETVTAESVTEETVTGETVTGEGLTLAEETVSGGAVTGGAVTGRDEPAASPVHPRVWQRRLAVLGDHGRRRLRWVMGAVAALVALCVGLAVLHTPLLALRHVDVEGAVHTDPAGVLTAAGLTGHPPLIDVDPKSAAAAVERLPWVLRAEVVRRWPDSVTIRITERVPVGALARPGGEVALVDSSGRVLGFQPGPAPGPMLVAPVAPGPPGSTLAAPDRPALEVAAALPASLAPVVRTVSVDAEGAVTLGLAQRLSAELGHTDALEAKLVSLESVLEDTHLSGPAVIDVTVPQEPTVGPPTGLG
jgi:cell division protein FtsQ